MRTGASHCPLLWPPVAVSTRRGGNGVDAGHSGAHNTKRNGDDEGR